MRDDTIVIIIKREVKRMAKKKLKKMRINWIKKKKKRKMYLHGLTILHKNKRRQALKMWSFTSYSSIRFPIFPEQLFNITSTSWCISSNINSLPFGFSWFPSWFSVSRRRCLRYLVFATDNPAVQMSCQKLISQQILPLVWVCWPYKNGSSWWPILFMFMSIVVVGCMLV